MPIADADFKYEQNLGSLYSIDKSFRAKKHYSPVTISNGLAWNSDESVMFYNDSETHQVWSFDFNLKDGIISKLD